MGDYAPATQSILKRFENLNKIPRKSKSEARITQLLIDWASGDGFHHELDAAGNLIIRVPASTGRTGEPTVVLQGHMDMVCEKTPESDHDFTTDSIVHRMEGEWLTAAGTTLGADNGIALALSMEVASSLSHPPLELLYTVDEETGLNGARDLEAARITGRLLINLDSEDEGVFTIGCAGGRDAVITLAVEEIAEVPDDARPVTIRVGGLLGGHSGVDIHRQRGNAIRILARVLDELLDRDETLGSIFGFSALTGGSARNAIPRDATVELCVDPDSISDIERAVVDTRAYLAEELIASDGNLTVELTSSAKRGSDGHAAFSIESLKRVVDTLLALPTGVQRMYDDTDPESETQVETSCNLAVCEHVDLGLSVTTSIRSSRNSRIDEIYRGIQAIADLAGADIRSENSYPAWPPAPGSPFLARALSVYETVVDEKPKVDVIHAGLECAVIGAVIPEIEMISIGPTIKDAHSPRERLFVPSVEKLYGFLAELLAPGEAT